MRRNIIETIMGAVVLVVAAAFIMIAFSSGEVSQVSGYEVVAEFDDATGVAAGSDVRMAGVKIGSVSGLNLDPETFFANVTLSIDKSIQLPVDTSARILSEGLLGNTYIALEPGGDLENLDPGARIEYTQGAVNLVDLLGRFVFGAADGPAGGPTGGPQ
ncbi:MAG: outer membrane lipid asymmetry maintenance protein MlaD [Rhodovibrionaceae bacterium]